VVLALAAYGSLVHEACMTEASVPARPGRAPSSSEGGRRPQSTASGTTAGKAPVTWPITAWPLWLLYAAVLAAAALAVHRSAPATR
jgi:hypothetical protein